MTYYDMLSRIRSIGQALLDLGLCLERPLVILSGNSIAHGLKALSAQYVGIPSAALAPAYSRSARTGFMKLREIAGQIHAGTVFPDSLRLGVSGTGTAVPWEDLLATPATEVIEQANAATCPDTVAKLMFTSGTTGSPKAVTQTQRMLCSNMEMVRECFAFLKDEPPVVLNWAPWNHVASGSKVFNMTIYNGGTFYVERGRPTPELIGDTIRNLRDVSPSWYFNVPVGYDLLILAMKKEPALASSFLRNLRMMMYAGAAMAEYSWIKLDRLAGQGGRQEDFHVDRTRRNGNRPLCSVQQPVE